MGIIDLINKKKAMYFKAKYSGTQEKSGILAQGVTKYGNKSVAERVNEAKQKFQQKKSERILLNSEKPTNQGISKPSKSAGSFAKGILNRINERAKSGNTLFSNQSSAPYYIQQQKNNNPFGMNTAGDQKTAAIYFGNSGGRNPFDFTNEKPKEKSKNIIIKIPK